MNPFDGFPTLPPLCAICWARVQTKEYPPWKRVIDVVYDFEGKRARADIKEGFEAGRTYIRRYDTVRTLALRPECLCSCGRRLLTPVPVVLQKRDYMIKSGEFADCERAYLGEL